MSNNANRSDSQSSSSAALTASTPAAPTQSTSASTNPGAGPHAPAAGPPGAAHVPSPQTSNEPSTTCSPAGASSRAPLTARGCMGPVLPLSVSSSGQSTNQRFQGLSVYPEAATISAPYLQTHDVYPAADNREFCDKMADLSLEAKIDSSTPLASPESSSFVRQRATETNEAGPSDSVSNTMGALSSQSPAPASSLARIQEANSQNPSLTLSTSSEQESQRLTPEVIVWIDNKRTCFLAGISEGRIQIDPFSSVDDDGDTQLQICTYNFKEYRLECWNLLAGSCSDWLSFRNAFSLTPLLAAVKFSAEVELVRALAVLSHALPIADADGNSALHYAAYDDNLDVIDALLQLPSPEEHELRCKFLVHPDSPQQQQQQQLQSGCGEMPPESTYEETLERHLEAGRVVLESRNTLDETALFCAVKAGRVAATQRLLQYGADPRVPEASWQRTALHRAVELANADLVELLLFTPLGTLSSAPISPTDEEWDQMRRELLLARDKFRSTALQMARASVRVTYIDHHRKSSLARVLALIERACDEVDVSTEEMLEEKEMVEEGSTSNSEMETSSDMSKDDEEEESDEAEDETMDEDESDGAIGAVDDAHSN